MPWRLGLRGKVVNRAVRSPINPCYSSGSRLSSLHFGLSRDIQFDFQKLPGSVSILFSTYQRNPHFPSVSLGTDKKLSCHPLSFLTPCRKLTSRLWQVRGLQLTLPNVLPALGGPLSLHIREDLPLVPVFVQSAHFFLGHLLSDISPEVINKLQAPFTKISRRPRFIAWQR